MKQIDEKYRDVNKFLKRHMRRSRWNKGYITVGALKILHQTMLAYIIRLEKENKELKKQIEEPSITEIL